MNGARWLLYWWCTAFMFLDGWWAAGYFHEGHAVSAAIAASGAVVLFQVASKSMRAALRDAYGRGQLKGLLEARGHLIDAARKAGVTVAMPDPHEDIR